MLRLADERTGPIKAAARATGDGRRKKGCAHDLESLVRQRVHAIALGHEGLSDHEALRTAPRRDGALAGPSTLRRLESRADRRTAAALHEALAGGFIASFERAPRRLALDADATDDRARGDQGAASSTATATAAASRRCARSAAAGCLRPGGADGARGSWAALALLTERLRRERPEAGTAARGDPGFRRWRMPRRPGRHGVDCVVGAAATRACSRGPPRCARRRSGAIGRAAGSGACSAGAAAARAPASASTAPEATWRTASRSGGWTCSPTRASRHKWRPNQFRLPLSSLAGAPLEAVRRVALRGTAPARARLPLSSACPGPELFLLAAARPKPDQPLDSAVPRTTPHEPGVRSPPTWPGLPIGRKSIPGAL